MRHKLTDFEFNTISKLTHNTHLDESFDIVNCGTIDKFIDRETQKLYDLEDGLFDLYDGLAYPLYHDGLNKEEAKTIVDLFLEYGIITTEEEKDALLAKENK